MRRLLLGFRQVLAAIRSASFVLTLTEVAGTLQDTEKAMAGSDSDDEDNVLGDSAPGLDVA